MKKSIKFTTYLFQKNSLHSSSIRPRNIVTNHHSSCHILYTPHNGSLTRSYFTSTIRTSPPFTYNKMFLNQSSFFPSFSKTNNNKRCFNNFFSSNFWSTKELPHSSRPQKFLDSSTSIN